MNNIDLLINLGIFVLGYYSIGIVLNTLVEIILLFIPAGDKNDSTRR